jgi:hypothetical protein
MEFDAHDLEMWRTSPSRARARLRMLAVLKRHCTTKLQTGDPLTLSKPTESSRVGDATTARLPGHTRPQSGIRREESSDT